MKKVSNALKNYIVDAILLIALGLVMLIWPQYSLQIIFKWVGIGLIVTGLIKGLIYFTKKEKKDRSLRPVHDQAFYCPVFLSGTIGELKNRKADFRNDQYEKKNQCHM